MCVGLQAHNDRVDMAGEKKVSYLAGITIGCIYELVVRITL